MAIAAGQQHITIGQIRITYLPDGYALLNPMVIFPTSMIEDWQNYQHLLNDDGLLVVSLGAHLIQTPDHTILIDTAQGPRHIEDSIKILHGGELLTSLKSVGLEPADIDIVFYTHLHIDHVGWTGHMVDNVNMLTFTRARHLVSNAEWRKFDDPAVSRLGVDEAIKLLEPCIEFAEDGQFLAPGVMVHATPGHTVGHAALIVTSDDERAIIMGDAFHSTVQFDHPEWIDIIDNDPELAEITRRRLIKELGKPLTYGVGTHFANAVCGRLIIQQGKHLWQQVEL